MRDFDFRKQLVMSTGRSATNDVRQVLLDNIPGALEVTKATEREDRSGTDYWIRHARGEPVSVDTKIRDFDPIERHGRDDLALETWSVVDKKIGWTLDESKRTDYVLWLFPTRRWVLIPFLQLQAAFKKRQHDWCAVYRVAQQRTVAANGNWRSECVFVPRKEIWAAIYSDFGGSGAPANDNAIINDEAKADSPTSTCDYCGLASAILMTGDVSLRLSGERPRTETRCVTVCSGCWNSLGFKYAAPSNEETAR